MARVGNWRDRVRSASRRIIVIERGSWHSAGVPGHIVQLIESSRSFSGAMAVARWSFFFAKKRGERRTGSSAMGRAALGLFAAIFFTAGMISLAFILLKLSIPEWRSQSPVRRDNVQNRIHACHHR